MWAVLLASAAGQSGGEADAAATVEGAVNTLQSMRDQLRDAEAQVCSPSLGTRHSVQPPSSSSRGRAISTPQCGNHACCAQVSASSILDAGAGWQIAAYAAEMETSLDELPEVEARHAEVRSLLQRHGCADADQLLAQTADAERSLDDWFQTEGTDALTYIQLRAGILVSSWRSMAVGQTVSGWLSGIIRLLSASYIIAEAADAAHTLVLAADAVSRRADDPELCPKCIRTVPCSERTMVTSRHSQQSPPKGKTWPASARRCRSSTDGTL